jgi:trehalose 6-phosphate phosphatase
MTPPVGPEPSQPRPLSPELAEAVRSFCAVDTVLVATDFDGVLAPIVQDPMRARPVQGAVEALARIARRHHTHAAVVSGRDLDTLTLLTGIGPHSAITQIGAHGAQTTRDDDGELLDEDQAELLAALTSALEEMLEDHPGMRLEHKPTGTVLHTRGEPAEAAAAAMSAAREVAGRHTGVHVLRGKGVLEMAVVRADKGSALRSLAREVHADAMAFFGDDVTDENAFAVMGERDLSVKVGPGDTHARFRVDAPSDVVQLLEAIASRR